MVCDPPAFAKSKKHLTEALKAYQRLERAGHGRSSSRAVSSSRAPAPTTCRARISARSFARPPSRSRREAQLLDFHGAAPDHPVVLSFPEGDYLKAAFLRVM